MATVIKDSNDAIKYMRKVVKREPGKWILVIGPSGSGKSMLKRVLSEEFRTVDMDKWGRQVSEDGKDKWIIDWDKVTSDFDLYFGTASNISEIPKIFDDYVIVRVEGNHEVTRDIMKAKLADGKKTNLPNKWLSTYQDRIKHTKSQYAKFVSEWWDRKLPGGYKYHMILSRFGTTDIVDGWDKGSDNPERTSEKLTKG